MDQVRKGADAEHQNNKRAGKKYGFEDPLVYWADMAVDLLTHDSCQQCPQCAGEQCSLSMLFVLRTLLFILFHSRKETFSFKCD